MVFPKKLRAGDTVALIAPSSPISEDMAGSCAAVIESLGYRVKLGDSVHSSLHGYEAGTGKLRANDINSFFADPEIRAVFCVRGGDSSSHVVDKVDLEIVKRNPKIFVGYSDVTTLHVMFNQKAGLVTFHGPMVKTNMVGDFDDFSRQSFFAALNMADEWELANPPSMAWDVLKPGEGEGILVGGNLSLIASMLGTPYEIDTRDKILFFEDVDEKVTRLDRMLYHLKYAGKFDAVRGVLLGDFADCSNPYAPSYDVDALFEDFFAGFSRPVMRNIKSGHCFPMSTLPLGCLCRMDTFRSSIRFFRNG